MRSVSSPARTRSLRTARSIGAPGALGGSGVADFGVADNKYMVGGAVLFLNNDPAHAVSRTINNGRAIRFTLAPRFHGKWTRRSIAMGRASGCAINPENPVLPGGSRAAAARAPEDSAGWSAIPRGRSRPR